MAREGFQNKKPTSGRASDPRLVLHLDDMEVFELLRKIDGGYRPAPEEGRALAEREALNLSVTPITALPESLGRLAKLQSLNLSFTQITALPESLGQLANLQSLDLRASQITALPEALGQLANLQSLNLYSTQITALPESLGRLANLQSLDLRETQITALPESLGQLANLQSLDLRDTQITALPESLGQLANLQSLDLRETQITALPESLGQLANLQSLNLSFTQITALPESLGQLAKLQRLDLLNTQITALPESLGQLAKLQDLDLSGTRITALPESLGQLANLQSLDLINTRITALPESICQLAKLQSLNLSYTGITALPESLGQLANLQSLDLKETQITALPESLGQLAKLQSLDLMETPITALPESLGQLSGLELLNLGGTGITELPDGLSRLTKLKELYLWKLKITRLPDWVRGLSKLEILSLHYSAITDLPVWIGELPALRRLNLEGLTLPAIPESLAKRGLPFVDKEYFRPDERGVNLHGVTLTGQDKSIFLEHPELIPDLYQGIDKLVTLRECRVIFLGDGAAGKSYTIRRFRNAGKKEDGETVYQTTQTPGVEILDQHIDRGPDSFDLHFWDFGGQELLHAMHRCFLTDETCYVVVVKTRETKANERARYWLRNVKAFAPSSPILLFVNCWEKDDGRRSIDEPGLREEFPMIRDVRYCSAKEAETEEFRAQLMEPLLDMAAKSESLTRRVPRQWVRIRRAIEAESAKNSYLDRERYHRLCAESGVEQEQAPELLSFFNELGVCFSYHRDEEKRELAAYKLLRPVWLTNAIYAVIEEGRIHAREGQITREQIERMLCNPAPEKVDGKQYSRTVPGMVYKDYECPFILDVAIAHELCYAVNSATLFFPALCGSDSPAEALQIPAQYGRHVSYLLRYDYLPDSVLHRLMIRCMRNHLAVEKCWLRGMVLQVWELHRIVVRMADDESLRIDIYSTGEHRAYELFWVLCNQIRDINRRLNLRAEEYIMDGKADFLLEDVVEAAERGGTVSRRGVKRSARELLGDFYEESVIPSIRVQNGVIQIPWVKREFTPCKKDHKPLRHAIFEAYNRICPYCGNPLTYREMQVDHILPARYPAPAALKPYIEYLKQMGFDVDHPDYIENYFPSHGPCNRDKSNRVNEFTLPYWHLIAAQRAKKVIELMRKYQEQK